MPVYKVSYVVLGGQYPGGIISQPVEPKVGDRVELGHHTFEVIETQRVGPPSDDFQFYHATVRLSAPEPEGTDT